MATTISERMWRPGKDCAKAWSISNFKSIRHSEVKLEPGLMTVLTGTNSIGKSSLLQSLLMACQSLNSNKGAIVLNGALTKLGVPEDVVRDESESCTIGIRYTIPQRRSEQRHEENRKTEIACDVTLKPKSGVKDRPADATTLVVSEVRFAFSDDEELTLRSSGIKRADSNKCMELLHSPEFETTDLVILKASRNSKNRLVRAYVAFLGLQPIATIQLKSQESARKFHKQAIEDLIALKLRSAGLSERRYVYALREKLLKENKDGSEAGIAKGFSTRQLVAAIEKMSLGDLNSVIDSIANEFAERFPDDIQPVKKGYYYRDADIWDEEANPIEHLQALLSGMANAFEDIANRVEYIGPLRDDPRVISPLAEEENSNLPVGRKGERAAAVLLSNYNQEGIYGFSDLKGARSSSFGKAVDDWARYLGVATAVQASSRQKLGISLNVSAGRAERDLTQIGVGASQAIPILVGVLSAKRGAIIIIEQPELHLHPTAQAKLADFLLYARPDVTILAETHSEALVTRLRRRVVQDEVSTDRINIQFFEKDDFNGGVIGSDLSIDKYGNLNAWPKGFMDAVQEDSRIIMKAAISKRKEERGGNDGR